MPKAFLYTSSGKIMNLSSFLKLESQMDVNIIAVNSLISSFTRYISFGKIRFIVVGINYGHVLFNFANDFLFQASCNIEILLFVG